MLTDLSAIRPERSPINSVVASRDIHKAVDDAFTHLGFRASFLNAMFYNQQKLVYTEDVPMAATDQHLVMLNPVWLEKSGWTMKNITFVIAHEICHCVYNHLVLGKLWRAAGQVRVPDGRLIPYYHRLMNQAMDYGINAGLVEAKIGEMPKEGLLDMAISRSGEESCVEIYAKLWDRLKPNDKIEIGKGNPIAGTGNAPGFDIHIEVSEKSVQADATGEHKQAIVSASNLSALGKGTMPGMFKKLLKDILEPKVAWQDHMLKSMQRAAGDPSIDWRYFDRRLMQRSPREFFGAPGHTGAGPVAVWGDTSGSVVQEYDRIFGEMNGIVQAVNPSEVLVGWCDAAVGRVDIVEEPDDLLELHKTINSTDGVGGGGGTDFRPIFQWMEDNDQHPDVLVLITDTYGTFPANPPDYPVIICSIVDNVTVPWGELIIAV